MAQEGASSAPILCPSARPEAPAAEIFGVVTKTAEGEQRIGYLTKRQPVSPDFLALAGQGLPTEALRIAAPCVTDGGCKHFDGTNCRLASRVTALLDPVVSGLPPCTIRPTCRWFRQEGKNACLRCPQIITDRRAPTPLERRVAADD